MKGYFFPFLLQMRVKISFLYSSWHYTTDFSWVICLTETCVIPHCLYVTFFFLFLMHCLLVFITLNRANLLFFLFHPLKERLYHSRHCDKHWCLCYWKTGSNKASFSCCCSRELCDIQHTERKKSQHGRQRNVMGCCFQLFGTNSTSKGWDALCFWN